MAGRVSDSLCQDAVRGQAVCIAPGGVCSLPASTAMKAVWADGDHTPFNSDGTDGSTLQSS